MRHASGWMDGLDERILEHISSVHIAGPGEIARRL